MGVKDMVWRKVQWTFMKRRLGYGQAEMKVFRQNPRNQDVVTKAPILINRTIIAEVIDSQGCNSRHTVGEKFYFDGLGNLMTSLCPKRICLHALHAITPQVFAATELICAGVDPNEMRFKHAACFDVGLDCGGFGRVVMEIRTEERKG